MIWLLMNTWWLVPALVALGAVVVFVAGGGLPVLRALAQRVPAWAWQALAATIAVSLAASWLIGIGEARCQAKFEAAEAKADVKAGRVAEKSASEAKDASDTIRKESQDAATEVRTIIRTVPGACPPLPPRVHDLGRAAVEAARRELPAGPAGSP